MDLHVVEIPGGWAVRALGETLRRLVTRAEAIAMAGGLIGGGQVLVGERDGSLTVLARAQLV